MSGTRAARGISRREAVLCLGMALFCLHAARGPAQEPDTAPRDATAYPEYVVKATFLYNFAKYVEWPADAFPSAQAPIAIGVVGVDPFGTELDKALANKTVHSRPFTVVRYKDATAIGPVHILFVSRSEREHLAGILARVRGLPVLTVGEEDGFSSGGGMVTILIEQSKPKLQINPAAAQEHRLAIDSRLLRVGTIVTTRVP